MRVTASAICCVLLAAAGSPSAAATAGGGGAIAQASGPVKAAPTAPLGETLLPEVRSSVLQIGHSASFQLPRDMKSIINPNPKVLTVDIQNDRSVLLFGVAPGSTELRFLDAKGVAFTTLNVTVEPDLIAVERLLRESLGNDSVSLHTVGAAVVLSGEVANSGQLALAAEIANKSLGTGASLINMLHSTGTDQITVSVRVLEIKRSTLQNIGVKWTALNNSGGAISQLGNVFGSSLIRPTDQFSLAASSTFRIQKTAIDAFVDFLKSEGNAKLLAEPTIVATSGKAAKFLVGGEIPVPVPYSLGTQAAIAGATPLNSANQGNTFGGILFKPYGISLNMTGVIMPDGRIDLQLNPEVSSVDFANAIEYGGNRVPATANRRAETQLKLESGETVILAGLTSDNASSSSNRLPAGPRFLDFLAGPQAKSQDQVELIIIVTPVLGDQVHESPGIKAALNEHKP